MSKLEELKAAVEASKAEHARAVAALTDFEQSAENNRFADLDAAAELEDTLRDRAFEDCQGAGNCGFDEYTQEFIVGEDLYLARLKCEYNRHDKTYYYLEEASFSIEKVG